MGFLALFLMPFHLQADEEFAYVKVEDAFIDLHTGPGRAFPVFYVAERGEWIKVLKSKTTWYKVRLDNDKEGWVDRDQMARTLNLYGQVVQLKDPDFNEYVNRTWEIGVQHGDLEGASVISAYGAFHLTKNISTELHVEQALGNFSEIRMASLDIVHQPWPAAKPFEGLPWVSDFNISPYFGIGTGVIEILPRATLVQPVDRQDQMLFVTAGARMYLTRRFLARLEYRNIVILTSRNDNDKVEQWTLGFSVFF